MTKSDADMPPVLLTLLTPLLGLLAVAGIVAGFATIEAARSMVPKTISFSRDIAKEFIDTNKYVEAYRNKTGHLPNLEGHPVFIVDMKAEQGLPSLQEAISLLGSPPAGSYMLEMWRGEWSEYYAPWSGRSTLSFDPSDYSYSGNLWLDAVIVWLITALFAFGAIWSWRRSR
jgi:hypothetical protein